MSAYIVAKPHLDLLVGVGLLGPRGVAHDPGHAWHRLTWWSESPRALAPDQWAAARRELNEVTTDAVGAMLLAENVASVRHRYADATDDHLPGPIPAYWREPYTWTDRGFRLTTVEALQAIRGYEYQACEHTEWETSEAKAFCDALAAALIRTLPGMDDAPWEWTEAELVERRTASTRVPRRPLRQAR